MGKKRRPSAVAEPEPLYVVPVPGEEPEPPDAIVAVLMRLTESIDRNTAALRDLSTSGKGQTKAIHEMHNDLQAWRKEQREGMGRWSA